MRLDSSFLTRLYGDAKHADASDMDRFEREMFRLVLMTRSLRAFDIVYRCVQEWNTLVHESLNRCLQTFLELVYVPHAKNDRSSILELTMFLIRMAPSSFVSVFNEFVYETYVRTKKITHVPINRGLIYLHHMREERYAATDDLTDHWWNDTACRICGHGAMSIHSPHSPFGRPPVPKKDGGAAGWRATVGGAAGKTKRRGEPGWDDEERSPQWDDDEDEEEYLRRNSRNGRGPTRGNESDDENDYEDEDDGDEAAENLGDRLLRRTEYTKCWQIHEAISAAVSYVTDYRDALRVLKKIDFGSAAGGVDSYVNYVIGKNDRLPESQRKQFLLNMVAIDMPTANAALPALFERLRKRELDRIRTEIENGRSNYLLTSAADRARMFDTGPHRSSEGERVARRRPSKRVQMAEDGASHAGGTPAFSAPVKTSKNKNKTVDIHGGEGGGGAGGEDMDSRKRTGGERQKMGRKYARDEVNRAPVPTPIVRVGRGSRGGRGNRAGRGRGRVVATASSSPPDDAEPDEKMAKKEEVPAPRGKGRGRGNQNRRGGIGRGRGRGRKTENSDAVADEHKQEEEEEEEEEEEVHEDEESESNDENVQEDEEEEEEEEEEEDDEGEEE